MAECDLLLVMGTSLAVHPFAGIMHLVGEDVPRLLLNREKVADCEPEMVRAYFEAGMTPRRIGRRTDLQLQTTLRVCRESVQPLRHRHKDQHPPSPPLSPQARVAACTAGAPPRSPRV